jgi:hypothetical protein
LRNSGGIVASCCANVTGQGQIWDIAGDDMGEFLFQFLFIVNSTEFTYLFDVLGFVAAQNA